MHCFYPVTCHCMVTFNIPRFVLSAALFGCLIASGCIFDNSQPTAPLTMQYVGNQGDTVSPLAVLQFAFSDSLAAVPLDFTFTPPVAQLYGITLNPSRDTATLSFVEMLPGNTRFVLKLASTVTATNGSSISPGYDSTVIWTGAREHEPNNSPGTADTLKPPAIWGLLSDAQDTDVYCVPSAQRAYYLETLSGQVAFSLKDSLLNDVVSSGAAAGSIDTFTVPDGTRYPVYIYVFSPIKGTEGYYRLGVAQH
jgi:hypothetical protein